MPELKAEGYSQCVMEIEAVNDTATKLTVTHSIAVENSKLINAVSGGWPRILSNLKSLIETGEVVLPPKNKADVIARWVDFHPPHWPFVSKSTHAASHCRKIVFRKRLQ